MQKPDVLLEATQLQAVDDGPRQDWQLTLPVHGTTQLPTVQDAVQEAGGPPPAPWAKHP